MKGRKTLTRILLLLSFALVVWPSLAAAHDKDGEETRTLIADVVLYEVTETVKFTGTTVTIRDAQATLMGFAKFGTPVCSTEAAVTNPDTKSCTVTGIGMDMLPLAGSGAGTSSIDGTFSVVINAPGNSSVHVPDLPVLSGEFHGTMDLLQALLGTPIGSIEGKFKITATAISGNPVPLTTPETFKFKGKVRLPFALDATGHVKEAEDGEDAFYLGDNGRLIEVRPDERDLGFPTVRLEITFQ